MVDVTGVIVTKLDSTAKGGMVFAINHDLGLPIHYIGLGERVGNLVPSPGLLCGQPVRRRRREEVKRNGSIKFPV